MVSISIVTINYNNCSGLRKTISSVFEQTIDKCKVEYIIVDGGSDDGSKLLIEEMNLQSPFPLKFVSERDHGVYHAMNKGISMSSDNVYLIFLNSGDVFCGENVLKEAYNRIYDDGFSCSVYYGDKLNNRYCLEKAFEPNSLRFGIINACHQSIFYKKSEIKYDLKYKLFSDYDFTCEYYNRGYGFKYLNMAVSIFEGGGISSIHSWKTKIEIYKINYRRFGLVNFFKFLGVKGFSLFKLSHLLFIKRHK
ncbi:MAG: glycosyltransferase [Aeromonadaceae bacterium]